MGGMKVYFTASLKGAENYIERYARIVKVMKDSGCRVVTSDVMVPGAREKVSQFGQEQRRAAFRRLTEILKKADLVVAEISTPSISIGYEVTSALELGKPVIVLFTKGNGAIMLEGMSHEKLQVLEYSDDSLVGKLKKALDEARKMSDVRFNFFVSPKILGYLDWVAQKRMIPRSVFLRNLIEKEMRKDKLFHQV